MLILAIATSVASVVFAVLLNDSPVTDHALWAAIFKVVGLSVAVPLTFLNHLHTRRSSTILLVFYPLYTIASIVSLRTSYWVLRDHGGRLFTAQLAVSITRAALLVLTWMIECFKPEVDELVDGYVPIGDPVNESPYATANLYSRIFFGWMTPLMKLGSKRYIVQEDMYDLDKEDQSRELGSKLQHNWNKEKNLRKSYVILGVTKAMVTHTLVLVRRCGERSCIRTVDPMRLLPASKSAPISFSSLSHNSFACCLLSYPGINTHLSGQAQPKVSLWARSCSSQLLYNQRSSIRLFL